MLSREARIAGLTCALVALPSVAWAQATVKKVQMRPIASVKGEDTYKEYCAYCHGDDLKGHGPNSVGLRLPPADLTTIASRNEGQFVVAQVEDNINRWNRVPRTLTDAAATEHAMTTGERSQYAQVMPVFGPIFARLYPQEVRDRRIRLTNLVSYIKSKQVAAEPGGMPK